MKVICGKCGSEASSKCPISRNIFPSRASEGESNFWQGMGFELKPADNVSMRLSVTMLVFGDQSEEEALRRLFLKIRQIPKDQLAQYICKHSYRHTEDCMFCDHKMVDV